MYADGLGTPKDPEAPYAWTTSTSLREIREGGI
jgi:hypothetical protein